MWLYAGTPLELSVLVVDQDHSNNPEDWAIRREDPRDTGSLGNPQRPHAEIRKRIRYGPDAQHENPARSMD
jgi:hypothetical protein